MISQLDEIITLLEATIPASPASASAGVLAKGLEKEMRKYFAALEKAMPDLTEFYLKHVEA